MIKRKNSTLFNTLLIYFVALIVFVAIRAVVLVIDFPISDDLLETLATCFIQIGIMFLLPIVAFSIMEKQKVGKTFKDFEYNKIGVAPILISVGIGFLCYFFNLAIASFFSSLIHLFGFENAPNLYSSSSGDYSVTKFFLTVLTVAVLPAICEETMHRGLLLKGSSSLGVKYSVILSSVLFGLMHLNIGQFFYATILGFIIAIAVFASKNIIPAMIIHFMNNFLSTYFSFATENGWFGKGLYEFIENFLYSKNIIEFFLTSFFMLLVLLIGIVFLFNLLLKSTRIKKVQKTLKEIEKINNEFNAGDSVLSQNQFVLNLHGLQNLMGQYNIGSVKNMVFAEFNKKPQKPNAFEWVLIVGCLSVGTLVTFFTFIWGVI